MQQGQTKPITVATLRRMKREKEPIAVITAYDYPSARYAERAGADVILVGDSLGNVVLGYDSTVPVTIEVMAHHTRAVTRATQRTFVVADMPFLTYHGSLDNTLANAARLMQDGLAKAIKMEGGEEIAATVRTCVQAGVPVMGHLGFTPQSLHRFGGHFIQGKTKDKADRMVEDALRLEEAGAFAVVLELVPEAVAERITAELSVPTIGIGAGRHCDGQVLVYHDVLGYGDTGDKRFVKQYAAIGQSIEHGIAAYVQEVKGRTFPTEAHGFPMSETE